jgi:hypothetical protein
MPGGLQHFCACSPERLTRWGSGALAAIRTRDHLLRRHFRGLRRFPVVSCPEGLNGWRGGGCGDFRSRAWRRRPVRSREKVVCHVDYSYGPDVWTRNIEIRYFGIRGPLGWAAGARWAQEDRGDGGDDGNDQEEAHSRASKISCSSRGVIGRLPGARGRACA